MDLPDAVSSVMKTESLEVSERVTEGDVHRVFRLVDDAGTQYVLKIATDNERERKRIKHEATVVDSLQDFDFVPEVRRSGVACSCPYILFEQVEGAEQWGNAQWETTAARTLGETLSRVHAEVDPHPEWDLSGDTHPCPESRPPTAIVDTLCELRTGRRRDLARLLPDVTAVLQETTASEAVIHADITIDNVRFASDAGTCTLLDWETAALSDAYFDVSKAELWLFQLFIPLFSVSEDAILSAFRDGYGVSPSAIKRIRAHKILQLTRMVPRIERLGPYGNWRRRVNGSCSDHTNSILERTIDRSSFVDITL